MAEIPVEIPSYKTSVLKYGREGEVFTSGVRISELAQRDFYALIGPGGLSRVPMNDRVETTYAVPGIEKVVIKPDSLIVRVTSPDAAEHVKDWLASFMKNNAEARARHEEVLRTPHSTRPEVEAVPEDPEGQLSRRNISLLAWHALHAPHLRKEPIDDSIETIFSLSGVTRVEFPTPGTIIVGVRDEEARQRVANWLDAFISAR